MRTLYSDNYSLAGQGNIFIIIVRVNQMTILTIFFRPTIYKLVKVMKYVLENILSEFIFSDLIFIEFLTMFSSKENYYYSKSLL